MRTRQPVDVQLQEDVLEIRWSDGLTSRHAMGELRRHCPCATCRTERDKMQGSKGLSSLRVIQSSTPAVAEARIQQVVPVGRYALSFRWNDGHQTGIYSYEFLLEHQLPLK